MEIIISNDWLEIRFETDSIYSYGQKENIRYSYHTSWLIFTFLTVILCLILELPIVCTHHSYKGLIRFYFDMTLITISINKP